MALIVYAQVQTVQYNSDGSFSAEVEYAVASKPGGVQQTFVNLTGAQVDSQNINQFQSALNSAITSAIIGQEPGVSANQILIH